MRFIYGIPAASVLLSAVLYSTVDAQAAQASTALPNLSSAAAAASSAAAAASTSAPTTTASSASRSTASTVLITGGVSISNTGTVPVITGGGTKTSGGLGTNAPKLPGGFEILPASVPPTLGAPFMISSSLPEGTLFIIVGAVLGALGMLVLAWRGLVVWSLRRNAKRANKQHNISDAKASFRTPAVPVYGYTDGAASMSMVNLAGKAPKRSAAPAPGLANSGSLFFSPTANAAGAAGMMAGNRGSNYLPSGYYSAGASAPGNGAGLSHIGNPTGGGMSLSNIVPHAQGYTRAHNMGPSPPDSPGVFPSEGLSAHGHRANPSTSTLELNRNPNGRAPSALLDDMFEGGAYPTGPHGGNAARF